MRKTILAGLLATSAVTVMLYAPAAHAQAADRKYDIAAQPLSSALQRYAEISGRQVVADGALLAGKRSNRVAGIFSADAALSRLLAGSGLTAELVDGALVLRPGNGDAAAPAGSTDGEIDGHRGSGGDAILVVGTRIRGQSPSSPVVTIDREAIEKSGMASAQQLLQALPQNFGGGQNESTLGAGTRNNAGTNANYGSSVNLRGLGASSTLVLIDGNRPALGGLGGVFADLSLFPVSAIERIEVLTDGASAIYGADAVAGVVNFRMRGDFEGAETLLRFGTADGDMSDIQAGQIFGKGWNGGHIMLAYQYSERGRLVAAKRPFVTEDLRPFGGPDYRSGFASPGTIVAANGQTFAIPAGQTGTALTATQLVPGTANLNDVRAKTDIVPRQRVHSFYGSGELSLTDDLIFRASLLAARRDYRKIALPESDNAVTVPVTNPFYVDPIGTNQPVSVRYSFANDLGPQTDDGRVSGITASAGLDQAIGAWRLQLGGGYGRQHERGLDLNVPNSVRLAAALADTNRSTALNVFGNGSANNPATLARIRGSRISITRFESQSTALRADGPLFALPGGDIRLAVGAEYRRETYDARSITDISTAAPVDRPNLTLPGPRHVRSLYGELLVPIFGPDNAMSGFQRLELSLAGRFEDYSDVGRTTNPKLGIHWEPVNGVRLRGSYGTSFRAPSFSELVGPSISLYLATRVADPTEPSGRANVLALFGYAPGIKPETATTWTVGADFTPSAIPALRASITYYDVDYRDRIGTASEDFANFLNRRSVFGGVIDDNPTAERIAFYFAQPTFSNPLGFQPSQITAILDGQIRNLSAVHQTGLDLDIAYAPQIGAGQLDVGLAASHVFKIDRQLTPGAPVTDIAGTFANPVKWRARGRLGWAMGGFSATLHANYVGGYRNQIPAVAEHVSSWTTFDFQLAQRFGDYEKGRGLQLALSALNLFDKAPPYVNNKTNTSALAYDPDKADAIGRTVALQATVRW